MQIFLIVVHVIVCFILILVILLQAGRGQGLTGPSFGSGNVQTLFGTRAGDFLSKATSVAAICFVLTCITLNWLETQKSKSLLELGKPGATLDMDVIKKALEKVKSEKTADSLPSVPEAAGTAAAALPGINPETTGSPDAVQPQIPGNADSEKPAADNTVS